MAVMSEQEAARFSELYTNTTPKVNPDKPGIFARQKDMVVVLDDFASKYLLSKMLATKKSPSELITEMVNRDIQAAI